MIDPIALRLGPLSIHWYGIIMATAILAAAWLGTSEARRRGENAETGWSMLLWAVVGGVAGARIYHVIHQWDFYSANISQVPQVWNGGLGIPGAVAGGAEAVWAYTRLRGLPTGRWFDIFVMALPLGQAIGRLGNFVNQELYGPPTSLCGSAFPPCLPFGIQIDAAHRGGTPWDALTFPVETTQFVPLFAYEMALNLVGMLVLLYVIRRFGPRLFAGDAALMYIMWYGAVRTLLETYRVNNWTILGVPTAMWVGIVGFVAAGAWLAYRHRRGWGSPMIKPAGEREADTDAARPQAEATAG